MRTDDDFVTHVADRPAALPGVTAVSLGGSGAPGTHEYELAEAEQRRFRWELPAFHLAGIPSYPVVGELAVSQVLRGDLPEPAGALATAAMQTARAILAARGSPGTAAT